MSTAPAVKSRQGLVQVWIVQMISTVVICGIVLAFARGSTLQLGTMPEDMRRYLIIGILAAGAPALLYLRHYKRLLDQDLSLERANGAPHPQARITLTRALVLGGALCEIPMALGVLQMFFGGETRWFLGATLVTTALRLSYRPFTRKS